MSRKAFLTVLGQGVGHGRGDEAGGDAFTVMPRLPTSRARDRAKPMTPALEAA